MANPADYVTLEQMKAYMNLQVTDTTQDDLISMFITSASRSVNNACGRVFTKETEITQRIYPLSTWFSVDTEDFYDLDSLVIETSYDHTTWGVVDPAGFFITPENALTAKGEPWPYTGAQSRILWPTPIPIFLGAWARVTTKYGWPAVPDSVVNATLIQAFRLFKRKDSPTGVENFGEGFARRVKLLDPDLMQLLGDYRKITATEGFA